MLAKVNGIPVHYPQHGSGTPVLALHGGGVDHREIMGALGPLFADRPGYRRIHPEVPGMGRTPAPEAIDSTDAVLDLLLGGRCLRGAHVEATELGWRPVRWGWTGGGGRRPMARRVLIPR